MQEITEHSCFVCPKITIPLHIDFFLLNVTKLTKLHLLRIITLKINSFVLMILVSFMFLFKLLVARLKEAFNNAKLRRDDDLRNTLILTTGEIGRYRRLFV